MKIKFYCSAQSEPESGDAEQQQSGDHADRGKRARTHHPEHQHDGQYTQGAQDEDGAGAGHRGPHGKCIFTLRPNPLRTRRRNASKWNLML